MTTWGWVWCHGFLSCSKCETSTPNFPNKVYIGLTEKEFKTRYNSHKQSFNNKKYANSTTLSSYIWNMKETHGITPTLKWSIIRRVKSYSNTTKKCPLCLSEKYEILKYPCRNELLNKRSEIISKCRHMNKFLLANYKSKDWFIVRANTYLYFYMDNYGQLFIFPIHRQTCIFSADHFCKLMSENITKLWVL